MRSKLAEWDQVMDRQLFAQFLLRALASVTRIAIPCASQFALYLPGLAASVGMATLIIPMLCGIVSVISTQTIANVLALLSRFLLSRSWAVSFTCSQQGRAPARTGCAHSSVAGLLVELLTTVGTRKQLFVRSAFPGTEARAASGLVDREGFAATLTSTCNSFEQALTPAFAGAKSLLVPLARIRRKWLAAMGTGFHVNSIA